MGWEQIYEQWKNHQQLEAGLKDQLTELEKDPEMLQDAFYMPLEFGTAGMRGILGPGINRMNIYTHSSSNRGIGALHGYTRSRNPSPRCRNRI